MQLVIRKVPYFSILTHAVSTIYITTSHFVSNASFPEIFG